MLKHMLTTKCDKSCDYCITRNVRSDINTETLSIYSKYIKMYVAGHDDIMLTGGEPTLAPHFKTCLKLAAEIFETVHITTANHNIFDKYAAELDQYADSVVFSLHEINTLALIKHVPKRPRVYGAILSDEYHQYFMPVIESMKAKGFAGLTINEEQRSGREFNRELEEVEDFSIKINRQGHCMDETIILPDLSVIRDFRPFL